MNLSIFTKGLILIGITLAFHLGLFGIAIRLQWEYRQALRWSNHSKHVLRNTQTVMRSTMDANLALRRWVANPTDEYRQKYETAAQAIPGALRMLQEEVSDNPQQTDRAKRMTVAADSRLAWMAECKRLVEDGNRTQPAISWPREKPNNSSIIFAMKVMHFCRKNTFWRTSAISSSNGIAMAGTASSLSAASWPSW